MDSNKKKLRNLLLYLGILIVVLLIIVFLFNRTPQQETYKYSDILNYFESGQVTSYRLNLGTGEMVLTLNDEKKSTVGYVVPSVDLFYRECVGLHHRVQRRPSRSEDDPGYHPPAGNQLAFELPANPDPVRRAHRLLVNS